MLAEMIDGQCTLLASTSFESAGMASKEINGAEFRIHIARRMIRIPNDEKLIAQLTSRRKLYDSPGREKLESRADLASRGVESSDRADALIGAGMMGRGSDPNVLNSEAHRASLVSCPRNTRILLRSKWSAGKARGGSISKPIRDRRATQPPAHFHRNPLGRGQLAVFPRCSLDPYDSDMGLRSRLEKQPTDLRQNTSYFGDRTLEMMEELTIRNEEDPWRVDRIQF
jgi:hypothetical protein